MFSKGSKELKWEERLLFKPKAKKTLLSSHILNSMNSNHHRTFNTCLCCSVADIEAKTLASKDPVPEERKQRPQQPCYVLVALFPFRSKSVHSTGHGMMKYYQRDKWPHLAQILLVFGIQNQREVSYRP